MQSVMRAQPTELVTSQPLDAFRRTNNPAKPPKASLKAALAAANDFRPGAKPFCAGVTGVFITNSR
jgi:hypothetical protein